MMWCESWQESQSPPRMGLQAVQKNLAEIFSANLLEFVLHVGRVCVVFALSDLRGGTQFFVTIVICATSQSRVTG